MITVPTVILVFRCSKCLVSNFSVFNMCMSVLDIFLSCGDRKQMNNVPRSGFWF